MIKFTKFDKTTGRILCTGIVPRGDCKEQIHSPNEDVVLGECRCLTQYVDPVTRIITDRPVITAEPNKLAISADGEDFVIQGLPIPCTITMEDIGAFEIDDGEFGFSQVLILGKYNIRVEAFPYMPKEWEVTVE